ncbi:MAG: hypothetical protein KatS3mg111_0718 [Pirellulaceae bacterium]|nr:MAG: hypothetical protein KatS3mg111_0718 [Pirellulaceae bacterium]
MMQIPPASSAAATGGIVSQSGTKQATKGDAEPHSPSPSHSSAAENVEHAEASHADRDAQGQGDGLGERRRDGKDETPDANPQGQTEANRAPDLPGQPPSQLDILG